METFTNYLITTHAAMGAISMICGFVSIFAKKGGTIHKKSGMLFFYTMLVCSISALVVSILPNHKNAFLFSIGILTLYFLIGGLRSLKFKASEFNIMVDKVMAGIMTIACSAMITLPYLINQRVNVVLLVFGILGLTFAINDLRLLRDLENLKKLWLRLHLSKITSAFISSVTAFMVTISLFPGIINWFAAGIIGGIYISYWSRKVTPKSFATLLLILGLSANVTFAQTYSKAELITDLSFLNAAIENAHPINLNPAFKNDLSMVVEKVKEDTKQTYLIHEYENQIRASLAKLGCFHTSIDPAVINARELPKPSLPFQLKSDGVKLFAVSPLDSTNQIMSINYPIEIYEINGQKIDNALEAACQFVVGDDTEKTYGLSIFNKYGHYLMRQQFPLDSVFKLATSAGKMEIEPIRTPKPVENSVESPWDSIQSWSQIHLSQHQEKKEVLYLKIDNFRYKHGKSYHRQLFESIKIAGGQYLIIDLRGNGGGKGSNGVDLLRYFSSEEWISSDIIYKIRKQPKLQFSLAKFGLTCWELVHLHQRKKYDRDGRLYSKVVKPFTEVYPHKSIILVDGMTGSTASQFASLMKEKSNALIIGHTTGGGEMSHNGGSYARLKLPVSKINIRFPLVHAVFDIDQEETWSGLAPDIKIAFSNSYAEVAEDAALEKALEWMEDQTENKQEICP